MKRMWDAIVIGGGMGGLVAAGLLAKQGKKVLLLEKEQKVGGYVSGFWREGFYFDATGAFVPAALPGTEFHRILSELGVIDTIEFLPIETIWNVYPDFKLKLHYQDPSAYIAGVKRQFPAYENALARYETLTRDLGREFLAFESAPFWKRVMLPLFFPTLFRCARKSHGDILRLFFDNHPDITLALSALPTALPPSLLSYVFVAVLWAKVLKDGVFYPKGGMKVLSETIERGVKGLGVEISLGAKVDRILTKGRRAIGVRLSNGDEFFADWVIANTNPFESRRHLLENIRLYGRMHRLERFTPSFSAVLFYVCLREKDLPPEWPYFVSIHTTKDLEAMHSGMEDGTMKNGMHMVITTPSLMDSSLAPAGCHSLKVMVHAPRADLFEKVYGKEGAFDRLTAHVFSEIRTYTGLDLGGCALQVESATPHTLFRYTGNEGGAMYGLDAACSQVGPLRPPNQTAIQHLIWAGHYTHPSHGIVGSAMSGEFASRIVLKKS